MRINHKNTLLLRKGKKYHRMADLLFDLNKKYAVSCMNLLQTSRTVD